MLLLICFSLVSITGGFVCKPGLNSSLVFDPSFYLPFHPELSGDVDSALESWCKQGARLGRQATASFHSLQYLMNYPELLIEFGDDYEAAVEHYVNFGHAEGRRGFVEGGAFGRWTIEGPAGEGGAVYISTSERLAGAVDSLSWNNKEFINNRDHGRQMQMAMAQARPQECWNPTEGGGYIDGTGLTSSSILENISTNSGELETLIRPAYWQPANFPWGTLFPHDHCCRNKTLGADCSYNSEKNHDGAMRKVITIGCFDMPNCVRWESSAELGIRQDRPEGRNGHLTSPSTHLVADISEPFTLDLATGETFALPLNENGHATSEDPIILSSTDGMYALGHFTYPLAFDHDNFNWYSVSRHIGPNHIQTVHNSAVVFHRSHGPGEVYRQISYVCVGTFTMVVHCLITVAENVDGPNV